MKNTAQNLTATEAARLTDAALRIATQDLWPRSATDRDPEAFLSECVATWIAARMRDRVVEPTVIADTCATHLGAQIGHYFQDGLPIVSFHLAGIRGWAPCLHGALNDWIDQWQQATGRRV